MSTDLKRQTLRVGLIVNPIAGMGGAVGLKGSDGSRASRAAALGATPIAANRAGKTLQTLRDCADRFEFLSCAGDMGQHVLASAGIPATVVYTPIGVATGAEDTRGAARALSRRGADLILFAGGDGTAGDVLAAVGSRVPLLGIPAGVKMHSAVFASSPQAAGDVLHAYLTADDREAALRDAEIMDRPDDGTDAASPVLLGFAVVPDVPLLIAPAKAAGRTDSVEGACRDALERIDDSRITLIGPGGTMQRIKRAFGSRGSLLGVDAVRNGQVLGADLRESEALDLVAGKRARIVLSVVGGQGFLFGRGNQQLSARVIRCVGRENILVVSSMEKLIALDNRRLLVDTGDDDLDEALAGFMPVLVGYRKSIQMPVGLPRSNKAISAGRIGETAAAATHE